MNETKPTDKLEDLILLLLDAEHDFGKSGEYRRADDGGVWELDDQGNLLKFDPMLPESTYTFDMTDRDRLFSSSAYGLLDHPADILGDSAEVGMVMEDDTLKWLGFRRLAKKPNRVSALGRVSVWYEMHFRRVYPNGVGQYQKRVVPLDSKGRALPAKIGGHVVCAPGIEGLNLTLSASMIEDAHRANTMLASVKDGSEVKLSVPLNDYKSVFSGRDAPMSNGRRKAIVHWVAQHMRNTKIGDQVPVKKHVRGVSDIVVDGLHISITPNTGFAPGHKPAKCVS